MTRLFLPPFLLALLACAGVTEAPPMDVQTLERLGRIDVPDDATEVRATGDSGIDTRVIARMRLPAAGADAFVRGAGFAPEAVRTGVNPFVEEGGMPDWWTSEAIPGSRGGERLAKGYCWQLRLDPRPDGDWDVFFVGFST